MTVSEPRRRARAGADAGDADARGTVRAVETSRAPWTMDPAEMDAYTETLSCIAMAPLACLTMPQVWKNFVNMTTGDAAAIGAVSWQAYAAGMLGNLLLLSYFAEKRERAATGAQVVGVVTSFFLLSQIAWSGNMHNVAPVEMLWTSAFVIGGSLLSVARYFEYAHGNLGAKAWELYTATLGVVGVLTAPTIISHALAPGLGWLPTEIMVLALLLAARAEKLPEKWSECSGWTANVLFMSMPVVQIAQNLQNPETLQGLSALTSVFITMGNALMLARAIFVKDFVWIVGSAWATYVGGFGVLATLFLLTNPMTSERYLGEFEFIAITVTLILYTAIVIGGQLRAQLAQGAASESPDGE